MSAAASGSVCRVLEALARWMFPRKQPPHCYYKPPLWWNWSEGGQGRKVDSVRADWRNPAAWRRKVNKEKNLAFTQTVTQKTNRKSNWYDKGVKQESKMKKRSFHRLCPVMNALRWNLKDLKTSILSLSITFGNKFCLWTSPCNQVSKHVIYIQNISNYCYNYRL